MGSYGLECPKLRAIEAFPVRADGREAICLRDPQRVAPQALTVSPETLFVISLFDGRRTRLDIQAAYARRFGGLLFSNVLDELIRKLDECYLLESQRFREHHQGLVREFAALETRPAGCAGGAYPADPEELRVWLDGFFKAEGGCGPIAPNRKGDTVRAAVAPHIDLHRGGACYAWAYKELAESCDAERFVILGIAHHGCESVFALTRKSFETPLGPVAADEDFIERLSAHAAGDLFKDEFAHKDEHSVELQALFLQHVFGEERELRIVPVLCGPFEDRVPEGQSPMEEPAIADFIQALRRTMEGSDGNVCVIASADLSHVGRQFGDDVSMTPGLLERVRAADQESLAAVEAMDAEEFFERIRRDNNPLHVCGYPAIYTLMQATDAKKGRLLNYAQAVTQETQSVVTFAGMSFE